ncbi:FAD-binding domain-containing protein [Trichodelitschia bisporula]|uniref:FAD-binding domain-containing protein n=1 Tax=Trichodelitschia bisporula TaxID=703511 RepID=A0A6G1I4D4_9PEZI|nr:FAD-binding domain-containing protein [Trichodelitschia bisporula]
MVMEVYSSVPFENWGHSVSNTPAYTAVPTTVLGVQNLVRYAGEKGLRVRAAGYRHSWAPVFGQTGQVLVSFVDIETAVTLPDPITIAGDPPAAAKVAELKSIEPGAESGGKKLVRVGAGVTSETLRRWQLANGWVLPVDTVLVEVTMGGITQGLCHGAGRAHKAIADYVRRIEYVDCKGKLQSVDDPRQLLAAAGNFGLFGIVTHVTFELDRMSYALMKPRKIDISLAIPPLDKNDIPPALRPSWFASPDASTRLATATAEFETRALNDYYSEWFWCPYQAKSWVHTWNPTPDSTGVTGYPDEGLTFLEWIQGWIAGVLTGSPFFNALPGYWQAQLLATSEMAILPPTLGESAEPTIKTALPNALHFRRGVQNMRVRNMEFLIPLPPSKDDPSKPDLGVARRAWWDVIKLLYAEPKNPLDPSSPMRLLLEMRIIGDSDLLLAPMQGNTFGTAAIEVLTVPDAVDDNEWQGFLQTVADKWLATGEGLQVRPHLAKEWDGLTFKGVDARTYLRDVAMKEQIAVWKTAAAEIGAVQGWTVDEMRARFSNQLWDELMFK